ncbi:hypothetical protein ACGFYU_29795 [Streptomyces sp. NPDC048337]|uniref:hypothetical protein n=1 Tax=Streptomyces sp. NPDC048337 TaxID=3365535 RepID=UPI003723FFDF
MRLPDGFLSEEDWKAAVDAVRDVAETVRAAGFSASALEGRATYAARDSLAAAAVSAVLPLRPVAAVTALAGALGSFPELLPHLQAARARALADDLPGRVHDGYTSGPAGGGEADPDVAWRQYTNYKRATQRIRITDEAQQELLQNLPLPVVDDLIERNLLRSHALPAAGGHSLYLQARLTPGLVPSQRLAELGWEEEATRREFATRLAGGDVSVIDSVTILSPEQQSLAAQLAEVRERGRIPDSLMGRKWLWPALEKLAPHAPVNLRAQQQFASWFMVRRILRMVRNGHLARLHGDRERSDAAFRRAWDEARPLQGIRTGASWEARNICAYLLLLSTSPAPPYDDALEEMRPVSSREGMSEDQLTRQARTNLEHNREVLRKLRQHRDSEHVLNPYLALGVRDLAREDEWKEVWRTLRRRLDDEGEAAVNQAKDAIQDEERGHAATGSFRLPLSPAKWEAPAVGSAPFQAGAQPMPRRTSPATAEEREYARSWAAEGILRVACDNLGLPWSTGRGPVPISESSSE